MLATLQFFFGGHEKNYITIKSHYNTIKSQFSQGQQPLSRKVKRSKTTLHCVSTLVFQEALPTVYQKWNSLGRWRPEAWLLPRTSYLSASTVWRFQNLNQLTRIRWHWCICLLMWDPWLCISDNRRRKGNPARNEKNAYLVAPIRVPKSRSDAKPATDNLSNFDNSSTPSSELEQREQQS